MSTPRLSRRSLKRGALARLRALVGRFAVLTSALPDVQDAFDPDALPISFILERDGNRAAHEMAAAPPQPRR
jgi:hypothetical protein